MYAVQPPARLVTQRPAPAPAPLPLPQTPTHSSSFTTYMLTQASVAPPPADTRQPGQRRRMAQQRLPGSLGVGRLAKAYDRAVIGCLHHYGGFCAMGMMMVMGGERWKLPPPLAEGFMLCGGRRVSVAHCIYAVALKELVLLCFACLAVVFEHQPCPALPCLVFGLLQCMYLLSHWR